MASKELQEILITRVLAMAAIKGWIPVAKEQELLQEVLTKLPHRLN